MTDGKLAPYWRSKFCTWEVYSRCLHARCNHHGNPCSKQEDCPQRDAREIHQAVTDTDSESNTMEAHDG